MFRGRSSVAAWLFLGLFLAAPSPSSAQAARALEPSESAAYNAWLRLVQARIIRSVTRAYGFPRSARVVVLISIRRDGSVFDVHAVSSTDPDPRYPALGARTVARAGPFPPIPASYAHESARIRVPLVYNVIASGRHRKRR